MRCLSKTAGPLLIAGMLAVFVPTMARAQAGSSGAVHRDTSAAATDSLAARLARAEAAIEMLRRQLAIEASSVVKTRSRLQLELSGRVLTNAYYDNARFNSSEVPLYVREGLAPPLGTRTGSAGSHVFGASIRQTVLGASLGVDSVLGGSFVGDIDVDFFATPAPGVDAFPTPRPRLRTVRAQITWVKTEVMVGSDGPLIADVDPASVATVGLPGFTAAGNLWNWLPQARVSRELFVTMIGATRLRWGAQLALLAPTAGDVHPSELDGVDAGDRAARPSFESRVRVRWGANDAPDDQRGEVGIGVHRGWLRISGDTLTTSRATAVSMRVGLSHGISVRGEAYRGRAVRGLGGGAIGQNFGIAAVGQTLGAPLRNTAGWAQLLAQVRPTMATGLGCGVDVVNTADRPDRQRNASCAANIAWHPTQPVVLGFEIRTLTTHYASGTRRGSQINLAAGFEW